MTSSSTIRTGSYSPNKKLFEFHKSGVTFKPEAYLSDVTYRPSCFDNIRCNVRPVKDATQDAFARGQMERQNVDLVYVAEPEAGDSSVSTVFPIIGVVLEKLSENDIAYGYGLHQLPIGIPQEVLTNLWSRIHPAVSSVPQISYDVDISHISNTGLRIEGLKRHNGYYWFDAEFDDPLKGSVYVGGDSIEVLVVDALKKTEQNFECDAVLSIILQRSTAGYNPRKAWDLKMTLKHVNINKLTWLSRHVSVSLDSGRGIETSQEALDVLKDAGALQL
ncbi:unnamed protein product [Sympodiomycopsis kandeliae]